MVRSMDSSTLAVSQSSFAVVTFIVAPALLTNASSVLAMSTINRMLRTRDRMSQLYADSEKGGQDAIGCEHLMRLTDRVERQALMLLTALRWVYVALGSFVAATLVTLLAAVLEHLGVPGWSRSFTFGGMLLGISGVTGLICGCVNLFRTTKLSMSNIAEEAMLIRERQAQRKAEHPPGQC